MPNSTLSTQKPSSNNDNTTGSIAWLIFGVIGIVFLVIAVVVIGILFLFRRKLFTKCFVENSHTADDIEQTKYLQEMTVDPEVMDKSSNQQVNNEIATIRYTEDPTMNMKKSRKQSPAYENLIKSSETRKFQSYDYVDQRSFMSSETRKFQSYDYVDQRSFMLSNSTNVEKNRIDTPVQSASTDFPNSKTNRESSYSLPSCKKTEYLESEFCLGNVYKCITTDTKPVRAIEVNQKRCNKDNVNLPTAVKSVPTGQDPIVQSRSPQSSHSDILYTAGINKSANVWSSENSESFASIDLTCDGTHLHCFVDKRLFRNYKDSLKSEFNDTDVTENESFAVDLTCDGTHLHCFVDKRLFMNYKDSLQSKMNDTDVTVNDLFYFYEKESDTLKPRSEYVVLTTFLKNRLRAELVQESLAVAIQNNKYCLCRWLLSNYTYDEEFLATVLKKAYKIGNYENIKSLAWILTRRFYQTFKSILNESASDIYPAFRCECQSSPEDISCLLRSKKMIVIEMNREVVVNIPDKYMNFEVTVFISDDSRSAESSKTQKHETGEILSKVRDLFGTNSHHLKMHPLDGDTASLLFKQHNKLSLICPSRLRSSNYGTNHTIEQIQCIQLYCERKGIIPLGEKHFPKTIKGIQTDVLQGRCQLAATTLRVGDRIGTLRTCGTLGGFYRFSGKLECLMTCAHVFYSLPTLLAPPDHMCHDQGVDVLWDPAQTQRQCGVVIRRIFKHDDPSTTSVDAALVYFNSADFAIDPNDIVRDINGASQTTRYLGMLSPFVNQNYCSHAALCCAGSTVSTVAIGAVTKTAQDVTFQGQIYRDVCFHELGPINGHANGVNIQPLLIAQPAHMQLHVGSLTEKRMFTMYNQMVMNIPLKEGDSGTCIYITGNTPQNTGCVGMAVAFCSGLSLVTPMQDIVSAVNS